MKRILAAAVVLVALCAGAAHADSAGVPLAPILVVRGPFRHVIAGASVVDGAGHVLPSASAEVRVPAGSRVRRSFAVWGGSGTAPDEDITLDAPGREQPAALHASSCISGATGDLAYWTCRASIDDLAASGLAGTWTASGLDVDTGAPWRAAHAFAGAFAVASVYADPNDDTPRVVQIVEGLFWSVDERTATAPLLPFSSAGEGGAVTVMSLAAQPGFPRAGTCDGTLADASCEFVGLCRGACSDAELTLDDDENPAGDVLNASSGAALDVDAFSFDDALAPGRYDDLRAFVQSGDGGAVVALVGVDVADVDEDGDGLSDDAEAELGTDPHSPDSDGDGVLDGVEVYGGNPARALSAPTDPLNPDSDGDGLVDGVEDANRNGLFDAGETSARRSDTDGDGLSDGVEAGAAYPGPACIGGHSDPLDTDSDGDGKHDGAEDANRDGITEPGEDSPCRIEPTAVVLPPVALPPPAQHAPDLAPPPVLSHPQGPQPRPAARPVLDVDVVLDLVDDTAPPATVPTGTLSGSTVWGCSSGVGAPAWLALFAVAFVRRRRA